MSTCLHSVQKDAAYGRITYVQHPQPPVLALATIFAGCTFNNCQRDVKASLFKGHATVLDPMYTAEWAGVDAWRSAGC